MDESRIIDFQKFGTKQNRSRRNNSEEKTKSMDADEYQVSLTTVFYLSCEGLDRRTLPLWGIVSLCHSRNSYIVLHDFGGTVV
mmetsp:Transcript_550/g.612  ORF Transcript_550/g.612 Transcript_550/m.612 type:complete len:83 (+) Transcript_550:294-542(+)